VSRKQVASAAAVRDSVPDRVPSRIATHFLEKTLQRFLSLADGLPPSLVRRAAKMGIADAWRLKEKTSNVRILSKWHYLHAISGNQRLLVFPF
jgi:hypothetical protein